MMSQLARIFHEQINDHRQKHFISTHLRVSQGQSLAIQSVLSTIVNIIHPSGEPEWPMAFVSEGSR